MKPAAKIALAASVVLAGLVVTDVVRAVLRKDPDAPAPQRAPGQLPGVVEESMSGKSPISAEGLERFRREKPLRIGQRVPPVRMTDAGGARLEVPQGRGRPTVWVVDNCDPKTRDSQITALVLIAKRNPGVKAVAVLASGSPIMLMHYRQELSIRRVTPVPDRDASLLQRFRPPFKDPMVFPTLWAADGDGVLRFVAPPSKEGAEQLAARVEEALGLGKVSRSTGGRPRPVPGRRRPGRRG
jgi:hypothetical protein